MKAYEKHFTTNASRADAQKNFAKVVEWYGDKESAKSASKSPHNTKIIESYSSRYEAVLKKLAAQKESNVHSFEVKAIVGELDFVSKQLYQMKDVSALMREMAKEYQNNRQMQEKMDVVYGEDATVFIGEALEAFYK